MKFIYGLLLLLLGILAASGGYRECPIAKPGCADTLDMNPVCTTLGCTYSNLKHMKCAGGTLLHTGECK